MGDNGDNGIELTMIIGDKPHMNYPVKGRAKELGVPIFPIFMGSQGATRSFLST